MGSIFKISSKCYHFYISVVTALVWTTVLPKLSSHPPCSSLFLFLSHFSLFLQSSQSPGKITLEAALIIFNYVVSIKYHRLEVNLSQKWYLLTSLLVQSLRRNVSIFKVHAIVYIGWEQGLWNHHFWIQNSSMSS